MLEADKQNTEKTDEMRARTKKEDAVTSSNTEVETVAPCG